MEKGEIYMIISLPLGGMTSSRRGRGVDDDRRRAFAVRSHGEMEVGVLNTLLLTEIIGIILADARG